MSDKPYVSYIFICNNCKSVVANIDTDPLSDHCGVCGQFVNYNTMEKLCSICHGVVGKCPHTKETDS